MYYNFRRVPQTCALLSMEAGLTDHVWNLEELVLLLDRRNMVAA